MRIAATLLFLATAGTLAADGRIPIYQPTTITTAGSYYLTRDFTSGTTALSIQADGVDVDLNGHTIEVTTGTSDVITIARPTGGSSSGVHIHGGKIRGGFAGIYCQNGDPARLRIHDLVISGSGEMGINCAYAATAQIQRVEIYDTDSYGIFLDGAATNVRATLRDNVMQGVSDGGIRIRRAIGSIIRDNQISEFGAGGPSGGAGIEVEEIGTECRGVQIVDNMIQAGSNQADGIRVDGCTGTLVERNIIDRADRDGIAMTGTHYRVMHNIVTNSTGAGLYMGGNWGYAERNTSQGNSTWGLRCGGGIGPYYRANLLLSNTSGALQTGPGVCEFSIDLGENQP